MSLSSRMVAVLTLVGFLSGGFLATVGHLTRERIALNKKMEVERAILAVVPGASAGRIIHEEKDFTVYAGQDKDGQLAGFAVYAAGTGFQDKIVLMLGLDVSLSRINSLTILEQKETPGLGAKITDETSFLVYWEGKDFGKPLSLRKPPAASRESLSASEVNTITGATISSQAVLQIVNSARERIINLNKEGKLNPEGKDAK
ncbi:MAG: FMN-binding protein [Clostridiales bacterium]|nr:FMN-binding protein [Clostridiales bacterium]